MTSPEEGPSALDFAGFDAGAAPLAEMYRALVEEIPAILYINGPEAHSPTLFVSPQTARILGLPPEGWYDDTWTEHVHPDDREAMQENYARALRHGAVDTDEYRFVRPDGEVIWLHDTIRVIRDEHGEPALVQGVMFDITASKRNEELLARQAETLERIAAVGQRFTELLLAGGDLQAILDALAEIVAAPVFFDDSARQLVGFAAAAGAHDAALLSSWQAHSRRAHAADGGDDCRWAPVRLHDEEWGRLHILAEGQSVDEVDALALDRAAAAIGLWLLSARDRVALADRARSEFIADLWQGRRWSAQDARARSRSLGGDLDQPVLLGVAVEFVTAGAPETDAHTSERMLGTLQRQLQRLAAESGASCIAAVVGSVCLAIVGFPSDGAARASAGRLGARLQAAVREELRDREVSVGISRPGTAETLRRALTEAIDAAAHGARTLRTGGIHHSADLGLRHLLARLGDGPELSRFVEDELGPLLAHDATGKVPLIPTLRAYLESGGQKATAARLLHLERRSLYYRLDRIEALLDTDLDDPSARLRAQVALQSLDVLRHRNGAYAAVMP